MRPIHKTEIEYLLEAPLMSAILNASFENCIVFTLTAGVDPSVGVVRLGGTNLYRADHLIIRGSKAVRQACGGEEPNCQMAWLTRSSCKGFGMESAR